MRGPVLIATAIFIALAFFQTDGSHSSAQTVDLVRVFIDLPGRPQATDRTVIAGLGGRVRNEFATSNTISVEVPSIALPILQAALPGRFSNIREVPKIDAVEDQLDWGVNQTEADQVWGGSNGAVNVVTGRVSGAGVKVGVIDTGIQKTHPDLQANIVSGRNFVASGGSVNTAAWDDNNGHGTHVAGTIAAVDNGSGMIGVAPKASLYGLKVLDANGSGYLDDAAAAVEWASGLNGGTKLDVVNMSFGCTCPFTPMKNAVDYAFSHGVVVVAAAGNSGAGADTMIYPAKYDSVISVAATCGPTKTSYCNGINTRASFSSQGARVEIAAPGDAIRSTYPGSTYATMSGTSMASPHVAGVAALVRAANPSWTPQQVRDRLDSTATDLGATGRDSSFGYGLVNAAAAAGTSSVTTPPDNSPATHDLSITNAGASPSSIGVGGTTTVTISLENQGTAAESNVLLTIQDGSGPVANSTTVNLAAGEVADVPLTWSAGGATPGVHQIVARIAVVSGETETVDNSFAVSVSVSTPVQSTGYLNCGAASAVRSNSGDNNGYESNATSACADDSSYAQDNNSGTGTSTSCSSTAKDRQMFYNYGLPVSGASVISSIDIRLDAWVDSAVNTRYLCVQLSWDGGNSWTAAKTTSSLASRQTTYTIGGDNWGHDWTASELSDANFRVRVTSVANNTSRDFRLDWVAARATFQ